MYRFVNVCATPGGSCWILIKINKIRFEWQPVMYTGKSRYLVIWEPCWWKKIRLIKLWFTWKSWRGIRPQKTLSNVVVVKALRRTNWPNFYQQWLIVCRCVVKAQLPVTFTPQFGPHFAFKIFLKLLLRTTRKYDIVKAILWRKRIGKRHEMQVLFWI